LNNLLVLSNLAEALRVKGELDEAIATYRKASALTPKNGTQWAGVSAGLGLALLDKQNWDEAESLLRECLAFCEQAEPDLWTTANTQSLLGGALLGQKKYADAEPLLLKGYKGMKVREKNMPPQNAVRIHEALDRLIELYTAWGKPEEAKKWQAEKVAR